MTRECRDEVKQKTTNRLAVAPQSTDAERAAENKSLFLEHSRLLIAIYIFQRGTKFLDNLIFLIAIKPIRVSIAPEITI